MLRHCCIARPGMIILVWLYQWLLSPIVGPALPVRAELQQIFHRRGAKIRGHPGNLAGRDAYMPVPSLEPRRI